MSNRKERRKEFAKNRIHIRAARKKCIACERVIKTKKTKEHFWPLWLTDHCEASADGVQWMNAKMRIDPKNATIPLCSDCNHRLGSELERPVKEIFRELEAGEAISNKDGELLARWLWKFEGLSACLFHLGQHEWNYSDRWTLIERVLEIDLGEMLDRLTVAIGLINAKSDNIDSWPMGLDSPFDGTNAIFVSGVFRRVSVLVSLRFFDHLIPDVLGKLHLSSDQMEAERKHFIPPVCFPFEYDAVDTMTLISKSIFDAHEEFANEQKGNYPIEIVRRRLLVPNI